MVHCAIHGNQSFFIYKLPRAAPYPKIPRTPTLYNQGFFIYNYLVLHEARTFAAAGPYTPWSDRWPLSQRWVAHHFFYAHKPWAPWARCVSSGKSEGPEYLYVGGDEQVAIVSIVLHAYQVPRVL